MNKSTILVFSILLGFAVYISFGQIKWKISTKLYCIGYVHDLNYSRNMHYAKYTFKINNENISGEQGNGKELLNNHYIIEVVKNQARMNRISIQQPIDPQSIVPQPPGGWTECPINKDGSIKEKYKRHKTKEQTEEYQISGVEFNAQDSTQVTKGSIEFLNQYKPQN